MAIDPNEQRARQQEAKIAQLEGRLNRMNEIIQALQKHQTAPNAHDISKEHVGLNLVENLPVTPISPTGNGYAHSGDVYNFTTSYFLAKDAIFPYSSVVLGRESGWYGGDVGQSVMIGNRAGKSPVAEFRDFVTIGADTHPLASHTVTLGHTRDIFTMPKGPVTRADKRDFKQVTDLTLGLDFVMLLHPKVGCLNLREDYIDYANMPAPPSGYSLPPKAPVSDEKNPIHRREWTRYREAVADWKAKVDGPYNEALHVWRHQYRAWRAKNQLSEVSVDISKQQSAQTVLLADDLANAASILKKDFTGVVDFAKLDGLDIKGLRTDEMIPVLVKAIQDLHEYVHSDGFIDRMVSQMLKKGQRGREALRHAATVIANNAREKAHEEALAAAANTADLNNPA